MEDTRKVEVFSKLATRKARQMPEINDITQVRGCALRGVCCGCPWLTATGLGWAAAHRRIQQERNRGAVSGAVVYVQVLLLRLPVDVQAVPSTRL